jgi:hypothetical protein
MTILADHYFVRQTLSPATAQLMGQLLVDDQAGGLRFQHVDHVREETMESLAQLHDQLSIFSQCRTDNRYLMDEGQKVTAYMPRNSTSTRPEPYTNHNSHISIVPRRSDSDYGRHPASPTWVPYCCSVRRFSLLFLLG